MIRLALPLAAMLALPLAAASADEGLFLPPVTDPAVASECGACHMVFPPQALPARSWQKLLADLGNHFGEDASLDAATRDSVAAYLVAHAADAPGAGEGEAFLRGLTADATPLRITETPYWRREHDEISAASFASAKVKSPANCAACHTGAAQGSFAEPGED